MTVNLHRGYCHISCTSTVKIQTSVRKIPSPIRASHESRKYITPAHFSLFIECGGYVTNDKQRPASSPQQPRTFCGDRWRRSALHARPINVFFQFGYHRYEVGGCVPEPSNELVPVPLLQPPVPVGFNFPFSDAFTVRSKSLRSTEYGSWH